MLHDLESQPDDVLLEFALRLPYTDLAHYCRLSKKFNQLCRSQRFWEEKSIRDFPPTLLATYGSATTLIDYQVLDMIENCRPGAELYTRDCLARSVEMEDLAKIDYFMKHTRRGLSRRPTEVGHALRVAAKKANLYLIETLIENGYSHLSRLRDYVRGGRLRYFPDACELAYGLGESGRIDLIEEMKSRTGVPLHCLLEAAIHGDNLEVFERYVPSPRVGASFFVPLLSKAIMLRRDKITNFLLIMVDERGVPLTTIQLNILLRAAARAGNVGLVRDLVRRGATAIGSAIVRAGVNGQYQVIDELVSAGLVGLPQLNSALTGASEIGDPKLIQWLLDRGANDYEGMAEGAASGGRLGLLQRALSLGARDYQRMLEAAGSQPVIDYLKSF